MADETQIREFLRSKEPTQKVFPIPGATLAPETNAAAKGSPSGDVGIPTLDQPPVPRMVSAPSTEESRFLDKYSVPGVPMDMSQEIGGWTRFLSSFRRQKENEVALLQKKYGKDTVRMSEDGRVFVKVKDTATGKDKEIPADSPDINANDLIDLLGSVPEIGAGIIATIKGRKIPGKIGAAEGIGGTARDIVTGSVGAEYTGAVKDVAVSILDRGEPDLEQIAKERATMAVGDIALGGAMSGVYGFSKWIRSPLNSSRTQVQFDALKAKEIIKEKYGIDIPLTVAESTGSPLFSRYEAFKEKLPGGSGAFQKIKRPQEQGLRDLQALMMGVTPEADDIVGQKAIEALQGQVKPIKEGVETAAKAVKTTGRSTIDDLVTSATSPTPQPELHLVGKSIRDKVTLLRDEAKERSSKLYEVVNQMPGGTGKAFDTTQLSAQAAKVMEQIPRKGNVPLKDFAPDDVLNRLKTLSELGGEKLSLSELQQMRRDTYESMGSNEGVAGRGKHYLNEIAKLLTNTIEDGVNKMPGGELKKALQVANEQYKKEVVPFSKAGLDELFVQPTDPGRFIGDFEVAKRVFASPDKFRVLKETLGATSPEFVALKRSMADDILRSSSNLDNTLDPASLLRNLKGLRDSSPEMFKEVFGDKAGSIAKTAMQMNVVEDILKGKSIDAQEMAKLLSGGDITTAKLQRLVSAQEQLNTTYRNDILKKVGTGDLDPSSIKPSDFVAKFVESAEPNQLREVLGVLSGSPETMDQVRAKTLELLFRKAARKPTAGDINRVLSDDPTEILSGVSIANILKDKTYREKVRAIVGPDIYSDLENFIKVSATIDAKEAAYSTAGGMSAGSVIANIEKRGPLKFMTETAKNWTAAFLMTFPPARAWLARLPTNDPAAIQLMFTSPVMLSAIANEFGEDTKAQEIVLGIRKSLEQFLQINRNSRQSEPQQGSSNIDNVRSFLRTTNAPAPVAPANP